VSFWGGHPNNDLKINSSYLEIQKKEPNGWEQVYTDKDFCTFFRWQRRKNNIIVDIQWDIPRNQEPGTYRIRYYGHWKKSPKNIEKITGTSNEFIII